MVAVANAVSRLKECGTNHFWDLGRLVSCIVHLKHFRRESWHLSFVSLHFLRKENKRLTPKLPGLELLELIRKDFIGEKCKLLFWLV